MPEKYTELLEAYYSSTQKRVRAYVEEFSVSFDSGVSQGCSLSSILFSYATDRIMQHALNDF